VTFISTKTALTGVEALQNQAHNQMQPSAETAGILSICHKENVLKLLNTALAIEIRRHYFIVHGTYVGGPTDEFLVHPNEGQGHAGQIAERIIKLGGIPDFTPDGLPGRNREKHMLFDLFIEAIREELMMELVAIDTYRDLIQALGNQDSVTRHLLKGILAAEQEHADQLADLLEGWPSSC
jgi:bacterioferritin